MSSTRHYFFRFSQNHINSKYKLQNVLHFCGRIGSWLLSVLGFNQFNAYTACSQNTFPMKLYFVNDLFLENGGTNL